MTIPISGIIEGFYGPPWSFEARHRAVTFVGERGGNTYVYAPKNDPLHRDRWREPYLPEDWERFEQLAGTCEAVGVDLWFGISPLGLRVTDPDDVALLLAKVAAADAHGLTDLCLLVDDMPESFASSADAERFASLAAAHAYVVEVVQEAQRRRGHDRRLWFVPLHYHGDPEDPYVVELGASLDRDVAIMWTGPEVCSETIPAEHGAAVAASLQRPVLYWDNHPVNDGDMRFDPHLGPLRGRDPALVASTGGILSNVAIEPEASLLAVATFLEFVRDPADYDPDEAWQRAVLEVTGDEHDARAVAVLADLAPRSPLRRGEPRMEALRPLERFEARWHDGAPPDRARALGELADELAGLWEVADRLEHRLHNERLRADLAPWATRLRLQVEAAQEAADVLADALAGVHDHGVATRRRRVIDLIDRSRRTFHRVAGHRLEVLARSCLRYADELATAEAAT